MQISISARHGHLSQETQEKIRSKVERLVRYYDRVTGIEVTVNLEHKDSVAVEVRVTAEHADDFVASSQDSSAMAALDVVVDKIEQQLRKHKEKRIDHHRMGRRAEATRTTEESEAGEES
ncbi:MAG: ribosome-associated translation inhibitor RaiA [Pirellulales bacterium]